MRGVVCGSLVECLSCNSEVLGLSCTGVFLGSDVGCDTVEPQHSICETQKRHE